MTQKDNQKPIANIVVYENEIPLNYLSFVSAEYTEIISGALPRLVANFIVNADQHPLGLSDVTLDINIEKDEWRVKANVDDIDFNINIVTLFFTLAPREFYYISSSNKFKSVKEAVLSLNFSNITADSQLPDSGLVELNQVATTDFKFLNNVLRGFKSPSVFAYTLEGLNIQDLTSHNTIIKIDPNRFSYYIDEREKNLYKDSLLISNPTQVGVFANNSTQYTSFLEWGGIKLNYSSYLDDFIKNIVDNTLNLKNYKLNLRLTSQKNLGIKSGDMVIIDLPDLKANKFLVSDRLILIGTELKFNYKLKYVGEDI